MDLDCSVGVVFMRNLWPKNDRHPNCIYDTSVGIPSHVPGKTILNFCFVKCSLITFPQQWSFQLWRKILYTFWVVVIGFAMLTLIMIYTYQFDRFKDYWSEYLKIAPDL